MNSGIRSTNVVPAWLWLWMIPSVLALQIAGKSLGESFYRTWIAGELGLVETLTAILLIIAVYCAIQLYRLRDRVTSRLFGPFALVMALGCFYFAGEEASWGQHWIGYATPSAIAERNEQGEFNLHNDPLLEGLFDQLPRALLTLAALVGGILAPLIRRKAVNFKTSSIHGWIWPTLVCLPASVVAVFISLPAKLADALEYPLPDMLDISAGEMKELSLAAFLMIYLLHLYRSLKRQA